MQSITSQIVPVDGCAVNTLQGGDPAKTTMLFLHGKAFQAETWKELGTLQAAIDAGFSVLAIDLPGFGKTAEAEIPPEVIISGVMEATAHKEVILIGPSMGGKIALEFSLENPNKVMALVLIGAVGVQENKDQLHELPESTLILWGENDQISDPTNGTLLNEAITDSKLVIFKGAKHPCYLEQPVLWHETLLNFAKTIA